MCLLSHYHKNLVFTYESLDQTENAYKKLKKKISNLTTDGEVDEVMFGTYKSLFEGKLHDNLNTANAITLIYDLLKDDRVNDKTKLEVIKSFDEVLSLDLLKQEVVEVDREEIEKLINERNIAKQNKDYELADKIRNELLEKGIVLVDSREGTTYKEV